MPVAWHWTRAHDKLAKIFRAISLCFQRPIASKIAGAKSSLHLLSRVRHGGGLNKSRARIFAPIEGIGAYMQNAKTDNGERH